MKAAEKLTGKGGDFTLDDFLEQMQQVRKLGSMQKIMGMLPGMGQFREQMENFDEREIDRIQAIIQSMTPAERANPKMIDGSRRARIATRLGPPGLRREQSRRPVLRGPQDDDVDRAGRDPGLPGMPGMAAKKPKAKPKPGKGRRVSGNPAKAAQQAKAALEKAAATPGEPVRQPRGRGRRLREGRRRPRPAERLLQVLEVTGPRVCTDDQGARRRRRQRRRQPARRLVEGPRRCGPTAARAAAGRRPVLRRGGPGRSRDRRRAAYAVAETVTYASCTPRGDGDDAIVAEVASAREAGDLVTTVDGRPDAPRSRRGARFAGRGSGLVARRAQRLRESNLALSRSSRCSPRTELKVQSLLSTNDSGMTSPMTISCAQ